MKMNHKNPLNQIYWKTFKFFFCPNFTIISFVMGVAPAKNGET